MRVEDLLRKGFGEGKNHKKAGTGDGLMVITTENVCAKKIAQKNYFPRRFLKTQMKFIQ